MSFAYRMKKLDGGTPRYGNCECCGGSVDVTHMLTQMRRYEHDGQEGITHSGCFQIFGHKGCLGNATS